MSDRREVAAMSTRSRRIHRLIRYLVLFLGKLLCRLGDPRPRPTSGIRSLHSRPGAQVEYRCVHRRLGGAPEHRDPHDGQGLAVEGSLVRQLPGADRVPFRWIGSDRTELRSATVKRRSPMANRYSCSPRAADAVGWWSRKF